jgi:putative glutathione S-transferase
MGKLIDGVWHDVGYDTKKTGGRFVRRESQFRNWVTADGSSGFAAEPGRYHLYVSLACPWAHRTLIYRRLKRLEAVIPVSVVHWHMAENGWEFGTGDHGGSDCTGDRLGGRAYLHQLYSDAQADYTGRVTVPVLWDTRTHTIVSNESSEIIRMFNSAFDALGDAGLDLYLADLRGEIDALNETVFLKVNNGVYKAGFATSQAAYEEAFDDLFATLDELEARLARQRYLLGDRLTEADWRLFTTLLRFDPVYYGHFKCNQRRLVDYPHLWAYTRELYQVPGVAETVNFRHIKHHYYVSHRTINPTGIVPKGPDVDFAEPHGRDALKAA